MRGELYSALEYGDGSQEAVALVAGFAADPDQLDQAARDLVLTGRDVVMYTHDKALLLEGNPNLLPQAIAAMSEDFQTRTQNHDRHRFGGASLGAAIAAGMQKNDPSPESGLYAASGIDAAKLVMKNRMFRAMIRAIHGVDTRRTYEQQGYALEDLQTVWQEVQIPPTTPFTVALGGLDWVVRRREIMPKIAAWRANSDIHVIHKPRLGHNGTIKWFSANVISVLNSKDSPVGLTPDSVRSSVGLPLLEMQADARSII